jgi:hypothetical protein
VIEQAYRRRTKAEFKVGDHSYEIDFAASLGHPKQRNVKTKVCRNVRRRLFDSAAAAGRHKSNPAELPCTWDPVPAGKHCHVVSVAASSQEWQTVADCMTKTMFSVTILKIERIQNMHLHEYYQMRIKRMSKLNGCPPEEVQVWHGTRATDPKVIYEDVQDGEKLRHACATLKPPRLMCAIRCSCPRQVFTQPSLRMGCGAKVFILPKTPLAHTTMLTGVEKAQSQCC